MLAPILHPATKTWMFGKIENHIAKQMTLEEIEAHIADYNRLRESQLPNAGDQGARRARPQPRNQTNE